jgi:hypothetical protein
LILSPRIRKDQFDLAKLGLKNTAAPAVRNAVLSDWSGILRTGKLSTDLSICSRIFYGMAMSKKVIRSLVPRRLALDHAGCRAFKRGFRWQKKLSGRRRASPQNLTTWCHRMAVSWCIGRGAHLVLDAELRFNIADWGNSVQFVSTFRLKPGFFYYKGPVAHGEKDLSRAGTQIFIESPFVVQVEKVGSFAVLKQDFTVVQRAGNAWLPDWARDTKKSAFCCPLSFSSSDDRLLPFEPR